MFWGITVFKNLTQTGPDNDSGPGVRGYFEHCLIALYCYLVIAAGGAPGIRRPQLIEYLAPSQRLTEGQSQPCRLRPGSSCNRP